MKIDENEAQEKKKGFLRAPAKAAMVVLQLLTVGVLVFCMGVFLLFMQNGGELSNLKNPGTYTDTYQCGSTVWNQLLQRVDHIQRARFLNPEGVFDPEQKLDVQKLAAVLYAGDAAAGDDVKADEQRSYTGEQLLDMGNRGYADTFESLAYSDLPDVYQSFGGEEGSYYSCFSKEYLEDPAASFTADEVEELLNMKPQEAEVKAAELEERLYNGYMDIDYSETYYDEATTEVAEGSSSTLQVLTNDVLDTAREIEKLSGRKITEFSDLFIYLYTEGKQLEEEAGKTVTGTTLAEYAAKNSESVSLQEMYENLADDIRFIQEYQPLDDVTNAKYTNLRFYIQDSKGNVYTNVEEWKGDKAAVSADMDELHTLDSAIFYQRKDGQLTETTVGKPDSASGEWMENFADSGAYDDTGLLDVNEIVFAGVDPELKAEDSIAEAANAYNRFSPLVIPAIIIGVLSALILLAAFILSNLQSGHRGDKRVQLYGIDRIPTEVSAGIAIAGIGLALAIDTAIGMSLYFTANIWIVVLIAGMAAMNWGVFLFFYYCLVRRIKGKNLWKASLTHSIVGVCKNVYAARKTSSKLILEFGAFVLLHLLLITAFGGFGVLLCLILDAIVLLYLLREAAGRQTVIEGLRQIGAGDLEYKVDTINLNGDNLVLAETLNGVGDGLNAAIQERMKSERLKADLITNVSHDIKTPLTSIINYVDLLQRENIQDEKIKGYLAVLASKSQRLKQLTEDLVEASKVSSGNVKLEFSVLNLNELVQQINGEFDEKLRARNLEVVCSLSTDTLRISADGRRIWRVLENLYGNVVKYGMPGTRVYVNTEKKDGIIYFSIKNISENPLNINADELTERFIRGDVSRSTEGSGLGLSIAQNLTKLQHGEFNIYLDGDLFKVVISFHEVLKGNDGDTSTEYVNEN